MVDTHTHKHTHAHKSILCLLKKDRKKSVFAFSRLSPMCLALNAVFDKEADGGANEKDAPDDVKGEAPVQLHVTVLHDPIAKHRGTQESENSCETDGSISK